MTAIVQLSIVNSFNTTFFVTNINRAPTCCKHKFDIFIFWKKTKNLHMAWKNLKNAKQTTAQHFANPKNSPLTNSKLIFDSYSSFWWILWDCYNADCCCGNKYELRVQLPSDLITILHGFSGRQGSCYFWQ